MRRDAGLAGVRAHGRRTRFRGCFAYARGLAGHRPPEQRDREPIGATCIAPQERAISVDLRQYLPREQLALLP